MLSSPTGGPYKKKSREILSPDLEERQAAYEEAQRRANEESERAAEAQLEAVKAGRKAAEALVALEKKRTKEVLSKGK